MENREVSSQDLLTDALDPFFEYTKATQGQRFLNFLIDNVIMRLTLNYSMGFVIGKILWVIAPDFMFYLVRGSNTIGLYLFSFMIVIASYLVYYTLCEKVFRGRTAGKFITGTRAVRWNGEELSFRDALMRSLCRFIPFELLSGFGEPWHDSITHTMVIKAR
ncbi:MAG: RDD family protein [Ginsengibacter sp.]